MKLFIANYALWQDVLTNLEDRPDGGTEYECTSAPQFHSIVLAETPEWVQSLKDAVEEDVRMGHGHDDLELTFDWEEGEWTFPERGRPNRELRLYEKAFGPNEDNCPDAVIVLQQYEV